MTGVQTGSRNLKSRAPRPGLPHAGRRYPLLLHHRLRSMLFWPACLIALLALVLVILSPPGIEASRPYLVAAALGGWSVAALTLWWSLRSFACCRADGLWLELPFYRATIPYHDIQSTRLAQFGREFPPQHERWSRRRFLEPLFFSTAVVVELKELPASRRQLRPWLGHYLLLPDRPGFILPVRDWLGFHGELDECRSRSTFPLEHKQG